RIVRVDFPSLAAVVHGKQGPFDIPIEPVQGEVRQYGADDPSLGGATQGGVVAPLFQIAGGEEMPDEAEETLILDLFSQDRQEPLVVEGVEAARDVSLDEPGGSLPFPSDLAERGVTASSWAEAVGVVAELGLVVSFQDQTDHFLEELIRPRRK